ncbi:MAG TPA: ATP-binding protein [Dissulfurispiraceae bacterium]|nr:ATP-binding protein [Dissulfurispiraceae bacterium]
MMKFRKAQMAQRKLRCALVGPSGSGKTWTALTLATEFGAKRIGLIDSERSSSELYADVFDFDVLALQHYSPENYVQAIEAAAEVGFDFLIIDSLSHAWAGVDGALDQVDKVAARQKSADNKFTAWREVTPRHNKMVDAILKAPMHVIATLRSKMKYVIEMNEATKKNIVRKVGMEAIQRDGIEYEFDLVGDLDQEHNLVITKSRCHALADAVIAMPGLELAKALRQWCYSDVSEPEQAPQPEPPPPTVDDIYPDAPPENPAEKSAPVTSAQIQEMGRLCHSEGYPVDRMLTDIQAFGVKRRDELTKKQAFQIISAAHAWLADKNEKGG